MFKMSLPHLVDLADISAKQLTEIVQLACEMQKNPSKYSDSQKGKILATLFYEPSTRTQLSFQTAMLRLGGQVIGFDNPSATSVAKGENLRDTIKIIGGYADIVAMRHPLEGAAKAATLFSAVPLINAGDGGHLHPTQTLTDLVTLMTYKKRIDNLKVGVCGDLKNGRTVHSLIKTMVNFENVEFVLISTKNLRVPSYIKCAIEEKNGRYKEVFSLEDAIPELDVLYMTRIQRERFESGEQYLKEKEVYVLDAKKMSLAKKDLAVLHPLPKIDEIAPEVDNDDRALYFEQAKCGVYARMAVMTYMLNGKFSYQDAFCGSPSADICGNKGCITNWEAYLPKSRRENGSCEYCDK